MMTFFERYDFLLLALLFCLPPLLIAAARADLRPLKRRAALLALPFALTERFFYPEYWSPTFLFDLIDQLGFGIEDLLFVAAFGAFAATAYPALDTFGRTRRILWKDGAFAPGSCKLDDALRAAAEAKAGEAAAMNVVRD